jgi:hypothetical protein
LAVGESVDGWTGVYTTDKDGHTLVADCARVEDARLVAMVPEMLFFVESVLLEQLDLGNQGDAALISMARSIINKAKHRI